MGVWTSRPLFSFGAMAEASFITKPRAFLESSTHPNWEALDSITKKENPLSHQVEEVSWSALFDLLFF
jgi:hypothetical protein